MQGAPAGGGSSGLDALGDSIKKASITDKSPAGALAKVLLPPLQQCRRSCTASALRTRCQKDTLQAVCGSMPAEAV